MNVEFIIELTLNAVNHAVGRVNENVKRQVKEEVLERYEAHTKQQQGLKAVEAAQKTTLEAVKPVNQINKK